MNNTTSQIDYQPQLDSFRFFAVVLVIISHWIPFSKLNAFPNAAFGVTFFFVLSGFLISSNLLLTKRRIETNSITIANALKNFYIRRTLRIFPLYFLVIFLLYIIIPTTFKGHFLWYISYLPNILVYKLQEWPGMLSHFWSLGVEEQFYLLWPLIIFWVSQKWLKFTFLFFITISIVFKLIVFFLSNSFFNYYDTLPISCFDAFGMGALLSLLKVNGKLNNIRKRIANMYWILVIISLIIIWLLFISNISFLFGIAISLCSVLVIGESSDGFKGLPGVILNNSSCQYLGKISYGLYVYHNFIPWLIRCMRGVEIEYPIPIFIDKMSWLSNGPILITVEIGLLIILSSATWHLYERPINKLKKYFV